MNGLTFLCFVLHLRGLISADYAPVFIWGPHVQHEPAVALKYHCDEEFLDVLRKHSTNDTITFIAVEDQLSVENLSQCKAPNGQTCFKGIQSIETKLYLPNVEEAAYVIEDVALEEADKFEINLQSSGNFSESLKGHTGNYVFVSFGDDNYTHETVSQRLTRHDRMITSFYKEFLARHDRQIVVVFTGKQESNHMRFLRDVSTYFDAKNSTNSTDFTHSTDSSNSTTPHSRNIWKTESVLLYFTSIDLEISNATMSMNVTSMTVQPTNNATNANTTVYDIQEDKELEEYEEVSGTGESTGNEASSTTVVETATHLLVTISVNVNDIFKFVITTSNGYWRAHQFTWNDEPLVSNKPISASNGFSYHCTPAITITNRNVEIGQNETFTDQDELTTGPNRSEIVITWRGLQLQPKFIYVKGEMVASFSDAYDCVGFVSPGVLSGLFVCFLLVFVLFIGILCIMDIKPIDRFEDPKGPRMTITVYE